MAAEIIIAGVSGLLQAVDLWVTLKDRRAARAAFRQAYPEISSNSDLKRQARALESLVPEEVLEAMKNRVERCWDRYLDVLKKDEEFLPAEVDSATEAVKRCICRELKRIIELNGNVPEGKLHDWWSKYCSASA